MAVYTPQEGNAAVDAAYGGKTAVAATARTLTAMHPLFLKFFPWWVQLLDFYEGLNMGQYIHRHIRESADSHAARVERFCYRNYCAPVVDLYGHYVFSKPIMRKVSSGAGELGGEWEDDFLKNVDNRGTPIDRFMQDLSTWVRAMGHCHLLTDMPARGTEGPEDEAQRKAQQLRPYWVVYFPTETINWELDANGEFLWVRFREPITGKTGPFDPRSGIDQRSIEPTGMLAAARTEGPAGVDSATRLSRKSEPKGARVPHARYRTWTRQSWAVHEVKGDVVKLISEGPHPCGRVPVSTFYYKKMSRHPEIGLSLIHDICRLNGTLLNLDSLIDEAVYQQTINILCMGRQPTEGDELRIGINNVLEYSGDRPPFFLTPSTSPVAFMESRIQGLREEIFRQAKLGGGLGLEPRSAASGVVAAFEFNESNQTLADHAEQLQAGEHHAHEDWFRWMGEAEFRGLADYADDFAVQSFQEELAMVTTAGSAIRSPTLRRELEKKAAARLLPNADPKITEQIKQEIDFIPTITSTFSGPIFSDELTQQVKGPADPNPIGRLGEYVAAMEAQTGEPQTPGTAQKVNEESTADQTAQQNQVAAQQNSQAAA